MIFKVGDPVRCVYNDDGSSRFVGKEGKVVKIESHRKPYFYVTDFAGDVGFSTEELALVTKKNIMTNLLQQFRLSIKGEPEKTFIKAGIIDNEEKFTPEGKELFNAFLLKKFGNDFKTEIVDPLVAAQETESKSK